VAKQLSGRWRPTPEEVERIIAEMRPIIAELARHQVLAPEALPD
jgi:hypothetical protein